jgi:3-oxosteroid 1-dehydrogenase
MNMSARDHDVVVVGSGAAGMTAAIAAALRGLSVVVVDQADCYGGTTAYSGGAIWIPGNRLLADAGVPDSVERGREYLQATVGDASPIERRDAYLRDGVAMVEELDQRTRWMRWTHVTIPDYRPEAPGGVPQGRSVEAAIIDGRALGSELKRLRPPSAAMDLKGLTIQAQDFVTLNMVTRTKAGRATGAKVAKRFVVSKLRGQKLLGCGRALTARLRLCLLDLDVSVLLSTGLRELLSDADGRVTGIRTTGGGELRARRGVVLAAGGFSRNQAMREEHMRGPTSTDWSLTPEDAEDGGVITAARKAGAAVELMDQAWGMPNVLATKGGKQIALMTLTERGLPGCIVVNRAGERYANEAMPYDEFWQTMYGADRANAGTVPSWMIFDQRAKNRYLFLGIGPRQPFPRAWIREGTVRRAATIAALAGEIDVPPAVLERTVDRFNQFARTGRDEDFHRGESAYDRFYGDSTLANPSLAPLEHRPYFAVALQAGDLGTSGGLMVDERSRVRTTRGDVLPGLYAAGNCSAGVMGATYPGPGATIGAAMVSGYQAAIDLARATEGDERG